LAATPLIVTMGAGVTDVPPPPPPHATRLIATQKDEIKRRLRAVRCDMRC
jgi:hypothetical protein